jgi:hypothetical protein
MPKAILDCGGGNNAATLCDHVERISQREMSDLFGRPSVNSLPDLTL